MLKNIIPKIVNLSTIPLILLSMNNVLLNINIITNYNINNINYTYNNYNNNNNFYYINNNENLYLLIFSLIILLSNIFYKKNNYKLSKLKNNINFIINIIFYKLYKKYILPLILFYINKINKTIFKSINKNYK